jgi:hypothetical protein
MGSEEMDFVEEPVHFVEELEGNGRSKGSKPWLETRRSTRFCSR